MSARRCDVCGKFRTAADLVLMEGEADEIWSECRDCMSEFDRNFYFPPARSTGEDGDA